MIFRYMRVLSDSGDLIGTMLIRIEIITYVYVEQNYKIRSYLSKPNSLIRSEISKIIQE